MKFVSLVSSGIDSPVATYLISKKSEGIILVHLDGRPFTDDRENMNFIEANQLAIRLNEYLIDIYKSIQLRTSSKPIREILIRIVSSKNIMIAKLKKEYKRLRAEF